jgi:predicted DNA-binding protein
MKRTTIWLSEQQIAQLQKQAKKTGLTMAELIRRFIDEGIKRA